MFSERERRREREREREGARELENDRARERERERARERERERDRQRDRERERERNIKTSVLISSTWILHKNSSALSCESKSQNQIHDAIAPKNQDRLKPLLPEGSAGASWLVKRYPSSLISMILLLFA